MTTADNAMSCVVDGCDRRSVEPPAAFSGAEVLLCDQHRSDFNADPLVWDGELDATGGRVRRLWRREGIGSAS